MVREGAPLGVYSPAGVTMFLKVSQKLPNLSHILVKLFNLRSPFLLVQIINLISIVLKEQKGESAIVIIQTLQRLNHGKSKTLLLIYLTRKWKISLDQVIFQFSITKMRIGVKSVKGPSFNV